VSPSAAVSSSDAKQNQRAFIILAAVVVAAGLFLGVSHLTKHKPAAPVVVLVTATTLPVVTTTGVATTVYNGPAPSQRDPFSSATGS
jgi:hypothetical protein